MFNSSISLYGKWLILLKNENPGLDDIVYLRNFFKSIRIPIFCDLTVAIKNTKYNGTFTLYSVYKISTKQKLIIENIEVWNGSFSLIENHSLYLKRRNFQKETIRVLKVVSP